MGNTFYRKLNSLNTGIVKKKKTAFYRTKAKLFYLAAKSAPGFEQHRSN
jgi:hypothetical protein